MAVTKTDLKEKRKNGYYYIDGKAFPSITTILKVIDKSNALVPWASKIVATASKEHPEWSIEKLCAEPAEQRDNAGSRGTTVHDIMEALGRGNMPNVDAIAPAFQGYAKAGILFFKNNIKKVINLEYSVINEAVGYMGTGDIIYEGHDGRIYAGDFKTGKYLYNTTGLQLSAAKHAEYMLTEKNEKLPIPKITGLIGILLKPDGGLATEMYNDGFDHFCAAKKLYDWMYAEDVARVKKNVEGK
jgi:hypothetical protein